MNQVLELWHQSAITTLGLFWMAFWAFGLGYLISSMIQVFVTKERMQNTMGDTGFKSIGLGTFFGFISSSCSFAALATTRSLFSKGAGLISSLAFLLASTNLVIELGIVIAVFLSWQFVVGEYVGGLLLILLMWGLVRISLNKKMEENARQHAQKLDQIETKNESNDWKALILSKQGWSQVASQYVMEWKMVWKDVTIGFSVAGIIAVFVPKAFFETLFVGSSVSNPAVWQVLFQSLIGPIAAFFTFIGSMGNIPLAAVLYSNGVSYAGIMAFIFSDLIVFPVLRIQAKYYGWKMALYIMAVFITILVLTSIILHYGFALFSLLPNPGQVKGLSQRSYFDINYGFYLNCIFILLSIVFAVCYMVTAKTKKAKNSVIEKILFFFAMVAIAWLVVGIFI
ncbi:permease [Legionella nagasakiensis]|uniref:permease n=1 Tax=Legionella nagasakiensis TaxID=535290 RepID=UPI0010569234|nr:permease [Legionella nagasakiensis]